MHQSISTRSAASVAASICLGLGLAGCAASEKATFTDHLTATVSPGPAHNNDVIMAFSLDQPELPTAVARQSGN